MEQEIWKEVKSLSSVFFVSNTGKVKRASFIKSNGARCKERLLIQKLCKNGYYMVYSKKKYHLVHRLIAIAFIPNPENKPEIDHINTIRTDNRIENLRWVTHKENCNNPISLKKFGYTPTIEQRKHLSEINKGKWAGSKNGNSRKVLQFSKDGKFIRQWDCIIDAARAVNIYPTAIVKCCRKTNKTAKGYKWEYL